MFSSGSSHSIDKFEQIIFSSRLTNGFFACLGGGTIWKDWSRSVLTTGGTKKGHFWMQRIAETIGEFLGDWGLSRLITGGIIGGHYCIHNSLWLCCELRCPKQANEVLFVFVANHQLATAFWHRNTSALQSCLELTEVVPHPQLKTQKLSRNVPWGFI